MIMKNNEKKEEEEEVTAQNPLHRVYLLQCEREMKDESL